MVDPERRSSAGLCAAAILVAALACRASASTSVCGTIGANTTWNTAGSPYIVTCDVVVIGGAVLTINPGVIVRIDPGRRLVAQSGAISASGTGINRVTFQSSDSMDPGVGLQVLPGSGGVVNLSASDFSNLQTGLGIQCCGPSAGTVSDCKFFTCGTGIGGSSGVTLNVINSQFLSCGTGADTTDKSFTSCTFSGNQYGIGPAAERVSATLCTFNNNIVAGLSGSGNSNSVVADRCSFVSNGVGVQHASTLRRNSIFGNTVGVRLGGVQGTWECNDIHGNVQANAEVVGTITINAPNNWWGSTSPAQIDAGITDAADQPGVGFLTYTPFLPAQQASTGTCACTMPSITSQPVAFSRLSGQTATFAITASAIGTPTYQWKRNNMPLSDGGRFSGTHTATLVINPVARSGSEPTWTDTGFYTCDVTNLCGTASASVAFTAIPCGADFDGVGGVSVADIFSFLTTWFAGCP